MNKKNNNIEIADIIYKRQRPAGILFLLYALVIWLAFVNGVSQDSTVTFVLQHAASTIKTPDIVFHNAMILSIAAVICALSGVYQLMFGFKKYLTLIIVIISLIFTFSFISWSIDGRSISLTGLLSVMVVRSVPLIIGAMSGILSERAGVFNIAIEGMMLSAALAASVTASLSNLWFGLLAGIITGGLMGLVHAVLCVKYKANHIISGMIINVFSIGITSFFSTRYIQVQEYRFLNEAGFFLPFELPVLSQIPIIGPVFFNQNIFVYLMYILVAVLSFMLFQTRWGLRLRSVGEHPKAADTLGIDVFKTRMWAVILSGLTAGLGGAD